VARKQNNCSVKAFDKGKRKGWLYAYEKIASDNYRLLPWEAYKVFNS
jgi:hypothetical protein